MDFFELLPVFSYIRHMKILKILASNSKKSKIYGIFKKWEIGAERVSADILNTTFSLITSTSNNLWSWKLTWVCFLTQEIKKKWHLNFP